jgi:hypothetical protein
MVPATSAATATQSRAGPRRRRSDDASLPRPLQERVPTRKTNRKSAAATESSKSKSNHRKREGIAAAAGSGVWLSPAHWDPAGLGGGSDGGRERGLRSGGGGRVGHGKCACAVQVFGATRRLGCYSEACRHINFCITSGSGDGGVAGKGVAAAPETGRAAAPEVGRAAARER